MTGLNMYFAAEQALNALQFGMLLFLLSVGLSVVFGLMDFLDLAHGTVYMAGAYAAVTLSGAAGSFWAALVLAPILSALFGVLLWMLLLRRVQASGHLAQVLLTIGLIYIGLETVRVIFGDLPRGMTPPPSLTGPVHLFGIDYPAYRLFIIALGLAVFALLYVGLERTRLGAIVRAGVDDRATVETLGIDIERVFAIVFGVGAGLAGLAGAIAAPLVGLSPGMDMSVTIPILIVVVIGGLGSLRGALIGSLLVGFADTFGKILLPDLAMMLIYIVMATVLVFRPAGLVPVRRAA